jgi:hypothetical protein
MTPAEQARARRSQARATGRCVVCCCRPREPEMTRCAECRAAQLKRTPYVRAYTSNSHHVTAVRADEFCVDCQAAKFHRVGCVASRTIEIEQGEQ